MHKVRGKFDLIISDEHHRNSAFPKPNKGAKYINERWGSLPMIFLSGTPFPESYSQVYHSYWVSNFSPFCDYRNFYAWAKDYVQVTQQRRAGGFLVNDYSKGIESKILPIIKNTMITYSQKQSGFKSEVKERFLTCPMRASTSRLIDLLKKDSVVEGEAGVILAATDLALMQKTHQLCSGTVVLEGGNRVVVDDSKAWFIKEKFKGKKIGIFYNFKAEYDMLKQVYGDDLCDNLEDFNGSSRNIALQIVSGREGISLREADYVVYFNIAFSAVSYWQSRDRMTTKNRLVNEVYWIFSDIGFEKRVYKAVAAKKDYTLSLFRSEVPRGTKKEIHQRRLFGD